MSRIKSTFQTVISMTAINFRKGRQQDRTQLGKAATTLCFKKCIPNEKLFPSISFLIKSDTPFKPYGLVPDKHGELGKEKSCFSVTPDKQKLNDGRHFLYFWSTYRK